MTEMRNKWSRMRKNWWWQLDRKTRTRFLRFAVIWTIIAFILTAWLLYDLNTTGLR